MSLSSRPRERKNKTQRQNCGVSRSQFYFVAETPGGVERGKVGDGLDGREKAHAKRSLPGWDGIRLAVVWAPEWREICCGPNSLRWFDLKDAKRSRTLLQEESSRT